LPKGIAAVTDVSVERGTSGFVEGILVWTDKGLVPIESIRAGDVVLSRPDGGVESSYSPVLVAARHDKASVVAVRFEDPADGKTRVTYATDSQAFWCVNHGWTPAAKLRPRAELQTSDGRTLTVKQVAPVYATITPGRGWHAASTMRDPLGMLMDFDGGFRSAPGSNVRMSDVVDESKTRLLVTVVHLELEGLHSFCVGSLGVWVRHAG
jgi:hypothetical protein